MLMGRHAASSVRRAPSSPALSALFLALVALLFSHAVLFSAAIDDPVTALLKFRTSLKNSDALSNWQSSTNPCTANWVGVLCYEGLVWGLQLENMHLSGQIDVDALTALPMLRSLSFKQNEFEGRIPDWKKLVALKSLYISDNHFSGVIPADTFEGMHYLKKVHMENNDFVGPIPDSLSTPRLLQLKIENNQFSGPIPALREGITAFNASNNLLSGPIPPSLGKLDPSAFAGNKALCGSPVGVSCGVESDQDSSSGTSPSDDTVPLSKICMVVMAILIAMSLIIVILLAYLRSRRRIVTDIIAGRSYSHKNQDPLVISRNIEAPPAVVAKKADTAKLSFIRDDRERFDLQDLLRASAEVLGSGNFGSSYKAVLMDGQAVVVKRFKQMNNVAREEFNEHMRRIGSLQHPNLLPLVAYYYRKEEKLLVFDHVHNGSLAGNLHGKHNLDEPTLDWPKRLKIVKGVARGLLYLQSQMPSVTVAHGHLKSANVLLDENYNPLLMDYALVPVVNVESAHQLLVSYKSPEYAQCGRVTKKTDVWCLGILILEILTGKIPTNYVLAHGPGYDSVLAGWVNSIVSGANKDVFDREMEGTKGCRGEMEKLLRIAAECCEEDWKNRLDLEEALEKIEDVKEN